jgi:hypothetical protein
VAGRKKHQSRPLSNSDEQEREVAARAEQRAAKRKAEAAGKPKKAKKADKGADAAQKQRALEVVEKQARIAANSNAGDAAIRAAISSSATEAAPIAAPSRPAKRKKFSDPPPAAASAKKPKPASSTTGPTTSGSRAQPSTSTPAAPPSPPPQPPQPAAEPSTSSSASASASSATAAAPITDRPLRVVLPLDDDLQAALRRCGQLNGMTALLFRDGAAVVAAALRSVVVEHLRAALPASLLASSSIEVVLVAAVAPAAVGAASPAAQKSFAALRGVLRRWMCGEAASPDCVPLMSLDRSFNDAVSLQLSGQSETETEAIVAGAARHARDEGCNLIVARCTDCLFAKSNRPIDDGQLELAAELAARSVRELSLPDAPSSTSPAAAPADAADVVVTARIVSAEHNKVIDVTLGVRVI